MPFVDSRHLFSTFLLLTLDILLSTFDFFTLDSRLFSLDSRLLLSTLDFYSQLSTFTLDSRPSTFRYPQCFDIILALNFEVAYCPPYSRSNDNRTKPNIRNQHCDMIDRVAVKDYVLPKTFGILAYVCSRLFIFFVAWYLQGLLLI